VKAVLEGIFCSDSRTDAEVEEKLTCQRDFGSQQCEGFKDFQLDNGPLAMATYCEMTAECGHKT